MDKKIECNTCGEVFKTYAKLAGHILSNYDHRQGRAWARTYLNKKFGEWNKNKRIIE